MNKYPYIVTVYPKSAPTILPRQYNTETLDRAIIIRDKHRGRNTTGRITIAVLVDDTGTLTHFH